MKALGEIIAAAGECRMIISPTPGAPTGSTADDLAINKLYGSKVSRVMAKPRLEHPVILKTNILLHAHVLRLTEELPAVSTALYCTIILVYNYKTNVWMSVILVHVSLCLESAFGYCQ